MDGRKSRVLSFVLLLYFFFCKPICAEILVSEGFMNISKDCRCETRILKALTIPRNCLQPLPRIAVIYLEFVACMVLLARPKPKTWTEQNDPKKNTVLVSRKTKILCWYVRLNYCPSANYKKRNEKKNFLNYIEIHKREEFDAIA